MRSATASYQPWCTYEQVLMKGIWAWRTLIRIQRKQRRRGSDHIMSFETTASQRRKSQKRKAHRPNNRCLVHQSRPLCIVLFAVHIMSHLPVESTAMSTVHRQGCQRSSISSAFFLSTSISAGNKRSAYRSYLLKYIDQFNGQINVALGYRLVCPHYLLLLEGKRPSRWRALLWCTRARESVDHESSVYIMCIVQATAVAKDRWKRCDLRG